MRILFNRLLWVSIFAACSCSSKYSDPLSTEEALSSFRLHPDFEIQLFAAEPFVKDPVCMKFDADGNIYVVEMPDYPYRPEDGQEKGRIVLLKDQNGDGRIDKSIVFADKIMEATSILPYDEGLLVTSAPHILFLKDTNEDGVSDIRKEMFSGFFAANSEAQITSLHLGADNWIYASNNGQSGEVSSSLDPEAPSLAMSGADFRFRMDTREFEQISGSGQFGQTLDDYGHRFYTQNTLHVQQSIMPWKYWHRHAFMPSFRTSANISDHELEMFQLTPAPYWRAERTRRRNKDFQARKLDRVEYAEDHFTGASGGTIYVGKSFGAAYEGNVFTGDVAGNLVHRDVLSANSRSPELIAQRDEQERDQEFLASTDPWFRPVNFAQGPDGQLYILDYYRQHIETPLSIPDDLKADMDFMKGSEHGRIYRIQPKGDQATFQKVSFSQASSSELVALLAHPNGWHRSTAQRLILERQDQNMISELLSLFQQSTQSKVRVRAMYALEGLGALTFTDVQKALTDPEPGIRKEALVLAEKLENGLELSLPLAQDSNAQVAFQAALTLGNYQGEKVQQALVNILLRFGKNSWYVWAVLSSEAGSSKEFFDKLIVKEYFNALEGGAANFMNNYAYISGAKNDADQLKGLLKALQQAPFADKPEGLASSLNALFKGMQRHDMPIEMAKKIKSIQEDQNASNIEKVQSLLFLY